MDFKKLSNLIMIEQTLFALPFAFLGVLFAGGGTWITWILVMVALTSARTAGMSFNRVIDAEIDAKNPRTSDRLIPKGEVKPSTVWLTAVISSFLLIGASFLLNPLCFYLSFLSVFFLFTYSYLKRFSASSHFYLGLVEAIAPMGGYLAVTGKFSPVPFILGFVIMTWIAGLDIVYAILDMDFDRNENLHSIPARLGKKRALYLSALCYFASVCGMIAAGLISDMEGFYWVAILLVVGIFIYQQKLARSDNLAVAVRQFFKINAYVSPLLFIGTLTDIFLN